jgi:hypothetical protein
LTRIAGISREVDVTPVCGARLGDAYREVVAGGDAAVGPLHALAMVTA